MKKRKSEAEKKEAQKLATKRWKEKNPDAEKLYRRKWRAKNPGKDKIYKKKRYERLKNDPNFKEKKKRDMDKYMSKQENKDKLNKKRREDRIANPDLFKSKERRYRIKRNKDPLRVEKKRATVREWIRQKKLSDPYYKIRQALSSRLNVFLKRQGSKKASSIIKIIGCSKEELRSHLEKQFYSHPRTGEVMTWKNHAKNGWHVDHIMPMASFKNEDLNNIEVQKKIMHYTNLQPMWAEENIKKRDNINFIKADPKFTKVIFKKIYPAKSTLKDLDDDINKIIKKNDPDLEIELTVDKKRDGTWEAILFSTKPN